MNTILAMTKAMQLFCVNKTISKLKNLTDNRKQKDPNHITRQTVLNVYTKQKSKTYSFAQEKL